MAGGTVADGIWWRAARLGGVMRTAALLCAVPLSQLHAAAAEEQRSRIARGLDLAFVYFAYAGGPVPWPDLANHFSTYRRTRDEAERNQLLSSLRPAMERQQADVLRHPVLTLQTTTTLGAYNDNHEAFPLGFRTSMVFTFSIDVPGPRFALTFSNTRQINNWRLPRQDARHVTALLRNTRLILVEIDYVPVSARKGRLNETPRRIVEARATALRVLRPDGRGILGQMVLSGEGDVTPVPHVSPRQIPGAASVRQPLTVSGANMPRGRVPETEDCTERSRGSTCLTTNGNSVPPADPCRFTEPPAPHSSVPRTTRISGR